MNINKSKISYIIAMLIFGSIGLFVKFINMPSAQIVLARTIIGSIFLIFMLLIKGKTIDGTAILKNLPILTLLGIALASSWLLLFEAFKNTTVGIAIVLYYLAPVIVFMLSPILFKEKLTLKKVIGITSAIIGMIIINFTPIGGINPKKGIICAIVAAFLYAILIILNKHLKNIGGVDTTISQLVIAAFVILAYLVFTKGFATELPTSKEMFLLVIVGIVHTGLACYLFISNLCNLSAQNAAILSYIDPVSALIFASIFLGEKLNFVQMVGVMLILGGTFIGQTTKKLKSSKN